MKVSESALSNPHTLPSTVAISPSWSVWCHHQSTHTHTHINTHSPCSHLVSVATKPQQLPLCVCRKMCSLKGLLRTWKHRKIKAQDTCDIRAIMDNNSLPLVCLVLNHCGLTCDSLRTTEGKLLWWFTFNYRYNLLYYLINLVQQSINYRKHKFFLHESKLLQTLDYSKEATCYISGSKSSLTMAKNKNACNFDFLMSSIFQRWANTC